MTSLSTLHHQVTAMRSKVGYAPKSYFFILEQGEAIPEISDRDARLIRYYPKGWLGNRAGGSIGYVKSALGKVTVLYG